MKHVILTTRSTVGGIREVQCLCGCRFRASKWREAFEHYGKHLEEDETARRLTKSEAKDIT